MQLYFGPYGDGVTSSLGNYYEDSNYNTYASALPTSGDSVQFDHVPDDAASPQQDFSGVTISYLGGYSGTAVGGGWVDNGNFRTGLDSSGTGFSVETGTIWSNGSNTYQDRGWDGTYYYLSGVLQSGIDSGGTGFDNFGAFYYLGTSTGCTVNQPFLASGYVWAAGTPPTPYTGSFAGTNWIINGVTIQGLNYNGYGYNSSSGIYYESGTPTAWRTPAPLNKSDEDIVLTVYNGNRVGLRYGENNFSKVIPQLDLMGTGML